MAVAIVNQWQAIFGDQDKEVVTAPTSGRMLIAVIASRVVDNSAPLLNIGDVSRNGWQLLYDPIQFATSPHAVAQLQVEVWACPAAQYAGWPDLFIYASAAQITAHDVGSVVLNVVEVTGTSGQVTVDSVTLNTATASTTIAVTAPAPTGAANCLMVAAAVADVGTAATPSGTGWTGLTGVTNTTPDVGMASAWREATTGGTATFTLGTSQNWAGVVVALRTVGTTAAQPNANWPASEFLVGLGYDLSTPLSRVAWTNQTKRLKELSGDRGIQAELGTATQGTTNLTLDNRDGAYTPRPAGSATANAVGTTTTIKVPDAQATSIFKGDFFRLAASTGVLKQLAVFQVTATSSAAGTTTVTFTRADGTGPARAGTASGDLYVGIPVDAYIPYRYVQTWASQPYVTSSGWIRDIPVAYDGAAYAEAQAVGTDVLETLTAANLSALRGEILRRHPTHYWPMDDAAGSGYAANASGVSNAALTQTASKFGTGSAAADFGASLQDFAVDAVTISSLLGDQGTGWAQTGQTAADIPTKGYALVGSSIPDFPPIAAGVTIFGVTATTVAQGITIGAATIDPTVIILRNSDPAAGAQGSVIKLAVDNATSNAQVTVWDKTTHAATITTGAGTQLTGNIRPWVLTFTQTTWAIYVNANLVASGAANLGTAFSGINVGGEADQFFHGHSMPGTHTHYAVFGRVLTAREITVLTNTVLVGAPSTAETLSTRITRKLNTVGWKGTRVIATSDAAVSAEDAPSGSVADAANDLAGYQDGWVFPDGAGQLQYRDLPLSAQQTLRATLGESVTAGEIPYQPGMSPSFTPAWVYNSVQVANAANTLQLANPKTTTLIAIDDTSVRKYSQRTFARTMRFQNNFRSWDIAWWWLAKYAYPQKRVETVTIEASADPTRWPFVLGVEVGDLVAVTKRHLGAPAYTIRCQVLRVQPRIVFGDQTTGSATLTLAAAPPPVTLLNDAVNGIVGDTIMGV